MFAFFILPARPNLWPYIAVVQPVWCVRLATGMPAFADNCSIFRGDVPQSNLEDDMGMSSINGVIEVFLLAAFFNSFLLCQTRCEEKPHLFLNAATA